MAFGLAEVNIDEKGLQGRERLVELGRALESKGMSKYPKLHSSFKVQVPHMQEARFNSRWEPTISRLKWVCVFGESSKGCENLCLESRNPSYKPRLSGPSIRRTIAGSCQCSRSPLQVCKFRWIIIIFSIDLGFINDEMNGGGQCDSY